MLRQDWLPRILWPAGLVVIVTLGWMAATGRWNATSWRSPGADVTGDILEVAARVQVASEQLGRFRNTYGRIDRLGAPVGADWSAYPVPDRPVFALAGMLAGPLGIFGAINALVLLGYVGNALSFYWSARRFRWRRAWAAAGALLFAFAVFHQAWAGTLSLNWTLALPPLAVLLHVIAGRGGAPTTRAARSWRWLAAGVGLWLGSGNPYFTFVAGQLLLGAVALRMLRGRDPARMSVAAWAIAAMLAAFALTHWPWLAHRDPADHPSPLERNYAGTELYGLRPIEMVLPPASHRLEPLAEMGQRYATITSFQSSEPRAGYLGLAGLAGLAILLSQALRSWAARRPAAARLPDGACAVVWVVFLGCVGGGASLLAFFGLDQFRAGNRFSVFITAWSLLALVGALHRLTRAWPRRSVALAIALAAAGWLDQTPRAPQPRQFASGLQTLADDRATAERIAAAAGPEARVFQLPAVPFPEAPSIRDFHDYEHFRLFLAGGKLHLAYGGLRGSPADRWYHWAGRQHAGALPGLLEAHGFGALTIDRRAYAPAEIDRLIALVTAGGARPLALPASPHLVAFQLSPRQPALPVDPADVRFHPAWDPLSDLPNVVAVQDLGGWHQLEHDGRHRWRWAGGRADLGFWNGADRPIALRLTAEVSAISPGRLEIREGLRPAWSEILDPGEYRRIDLQLRVAPGHSVLSLRFDGTLIRPEGDLRTLGFVMRDMVAEVRP